MLHKLPQYRCASGAFCWSFASDIRPFAALPILLGVLVLSGCAGGVKEIPSGTVSGTITSQGTPLSGGRVNFVSTETGAAGYAKIESDGNFSLDGRLPVGKYKVFITSEGLGDAPPSENAQEDAEQGSQNVPEKYRSETTTDLTATIAEGDNTVDFDLQP